MNDLDRRQLEKVIAAREAQRAELAERYAQGLREGRFGAGYRAKHPLKAVPDLAPVPADPNWGVDAKGRRVWIGPVDADSNPILEGGA